MLWSASQAKRLLLVGITSVLSALYLSLIDNVAP